MNWFISFNTHAFIKSNRYTEKLLHGESMQMGIVLYLILSPSFSPSFFLSFSRFFFFSSFSFLYLIINHRIVNPSKFEANASRLEDYTATGIRIKNFLLSFFCFNFCLINTRMEDKAAETYGRYCHCFNESETMRIFRWTPHQLP